MNRPKAQTVTFHLMMTLLFGCGFVKTAEALDGFCVPEKTTDFQQQFHPDIVNLPCGNNRR